MAGSKKRDRSKEASARVVLCFYCDVLFTQSDTERVNKTIDKIEHRFSSYTEINEQDGKRDRTKEEVFLHENNIALNELPLEKVNQLWLKNHRSVLKKKPNGTDIHCIVCQIKYIIREFLNRYDVPVKNFLENDSSKHKFWTV